MVTEHHRDTIPSKNNSHRFLLTPADAPIDCFTRQYYPVYRARFEALRDRVEENAKKFIGEWCEDGSIESPVIAKQWNEVQLGMYFWFILNHSFSELDSL